MRSLVRILLAGFLAFMVLGVVQEYRFFLGAWFGESEATEGMTEEDQAAAAATVREVLTLMRHFYASGGDPRFADRIPASDGVIAEMRADVDYLGRSGRTQEPILQALEILGVEVLGPTQAEIRTKEYWIHHFRELGTTGRDGDPLDGPRSQVLFGRYLVRRGTTGWGVEATEFVSREEQERTATVTPGAEGAGASE